MTQIAAGLMLAACAPLAGAAPDCPAILARRRARRKARHRRRSVSTMARTSNVSEPTLTVFAPAVDKPNGTAVIICPGGGYVRLSTEREGEQYANWLSTPGRDQLRAQVPHGANSATRRRCRTCCARCGWYVRRPREFGVQPGPHRRDGQFGRRASGGQRRHPVRPSARAAPARHSTRSARGRTS